MRLFTSWITERYFHEKSSNNSTVSFKLKLCAYPMDTGSKNGEKNGGCCTNTHEADRFFFNYLFYWKPLTEDLLPQPEVKVHIFFFLNIQNALHVQSGHS